MEKNESEKFEGLSINVHVTARHVLEHVASKIDEEMELPAGDIAGPPPDSMRLAAVAIDALSDFGLIDGSYFQVVKAAREHLDS